jgi:hypothetical protein
MASVGDDFDRGWNWASKGKGPPRRESEAFWEGFEQYNMQHEMLDADEVLAS